MGTCAAAVDRMVHHQCNLKRYNYCDAYICTQEAKYL